MNDVTKERIADRVIKAMEEENLLKKEVADILGFEPYNMSYLKRSDTHNKVSERIWTIMKEFTISGLSLKEYKKKNQGTMAVIDTQVDKQDPATPQPGKEVEQYSQEFLNEPAAETEQQSILLTKKVDEGADKDEPDPGKETPEAVYTSKDALMSVTVFADRIELIIKR